MQIIVVGNVGSGKTQSRTVYMAEGISPTLCSGMDHGNTIPYIIEIKGVDKVNEQNTISRAEQSRAEQSRAEQSRGWAIFMVWMAAIMQETFTIKTAWLRRCLVCKAEGGSHTW